MYGLKRKRLFKFIVWVINIVLVLINLFLKLQYEIEHSVNP